MNVGLSARAYTYSDNPLCSWQELCHLCPRTKSTHCPKELRSKECRHNPRGSIKHQEGVLAKPRLNTAG